MLTPNDLSPISKMIDDAITKAMAAQHDEKPVTQNSYHDKKQIRKAILDHLDEFRVFVNNSAFTVKDLRCFLRSKIPLTQADLEIVDTRSSKKTRFDSQVCHALSTKWPESPFIKPNRNRYAFANGIEYVSASVPTGTRAVVVVDRGWIFAGDVIRKDGRILLTRAVWVFSWESCGFSRVIENPSNADIRPVADVDIPAGAEIFSVPVADDWGL